MTPLENHHDNHRFHTHDRKCPDYVSELNDYLDGTLDPSLCAEIEKHVGQCDNCRIMVDTLRQTVKLCRGGKEEPLPGELESRLNSLLKARWEKKFGRRSEPPRS